MRVVQEHYAARGWDVEDVSQTRPYDLVCRRLEEDAMSTAKTECSHERACTTSLAARVFEDGYVVVLC